MLPEAARCSPASVLTSVDLPAPLGPTTQTTSPSATSMSMPTSALRIAVEDVQAADLKHAAPLPRYALTTAGSRMTAPGSPSASTVPWSSTTTRVASWFTTRRRCSTRMIVTPEAWMRRTTSAASSTSTGLRPASASSSSSTRGRVARARAISSSCVRGG